MLGARNLLSRVDRFTMKPETDQSQFNRRQFH